MVEDINICHIHTQIITNYNMNNFENDYALCVDAQRFEEIFRSNSPIDLEKMSLQIPEQVPDETPMKVTRDVCDREEFDREEIIMNEIIDATKHIKYKSVFTEKMLEMCRTDPFAIPEHTREYVEYVVEDEEHQIDPEFEMLFRPLDDPYFMPNPELEELDQKLEKEYEGVKRKGYEHDSCEEDIITFAHKYGVSMEDAFEVMRRCHCCGSKNLPIGNDYCSGQCIEMCEEHLYECFMGKNCVICTSTGVASMARCFECNCGLEYDEGIIVEDPNRNETLVCRVCLDDYITTNYGPVCEK